MRRHSPTSQRAAKIFRWKDQPVSIIASLQWCHIGHGVSNHRQIDCSFNCLFNRLATKKTSKCLHYDMRKVHHIMRCSLGTVGFTNILQGNFIENSGGGGGGVVPAMNSWRPYWNNCVLWYIVFMTMLHSLHKSIQWYISRHDPFLCFSIRWSLHQDRSIYFSKISIIFHIHFTEIPSKGFNGLHWFK